MNVWNNSTPRLFSLATWSESACTQAMPCAGMKWEGLRITAALVWCTEASTRLCFLRSHSSEVQQTQWSRAMEMWRGARYSETWKQGVRSASMTGAKSAGKSSLLHAGT